MSTAKLAMDLIRDFRNIKGDIKVICLDGEFMANRVLISARSEPIRKMLSGPFKEGQENEIRFPEERLSPMQMFMNFLQWASLPDDTITIHDLVDLFIIADKYQHLKLRDTIKERLLAEAGRRGSCFTLYELCAMDILEDVRMKAVETAIQTYISDMKPKYICTVCDKEYNTLQCSVNKCEEVVKLTADECAAGHRFKPSDNYTCIRPVNIIVDSELVVKRCGAPVEKAVRRLPLENISDSILAEIMRYYYEKKRLKE